MKGALVGKNLNFSKSKLVHNYISKKYDLNYTYDIIDVQDEEKIVFINGVENKSLQFIFDLPKDLFLPVFLEKLGYTFINVTSPFKTIISKKYTNSFLVKKTGCFNIIYYVKNRLVTYNSDIFGFKELLQRNTIDFNKDLVYILGNGGVARSAAFVIRKNPKIFVVRKNSTHSIPENHIFYPDLVNQKASYFINTTTPGVIKAELFTEEQLKTVTFIDLNYAPTSLKCSFKHYIDGLDMLIAQAFKTISLVTKNKKIAASDCDYIKIRKLL